MRRHAKVLYTIGALLALLGAFLPWQREGDFVSYTTPGVTISLTAPYFRDNGGAVVGALAALSIWLFRRVSRSAGDRTLVFVTSTALLLVGLWHIGSVVRAHIAAGPVVGAPTIEGGLVLVLVGALAQLAVLALPREGA